MNSSLRHSLTTSVLCTSWEDIEWMSGASDLPIVLKGVSSPLDAQLAAEMSVRGAVAGIVISNHGGRNLDGAMQAMGSKDRELGFSEVCAPTWVVCVGQHQKTLTRGVHLDFNTLRTV